MGTLLNLAEALRRLLERIALASGWLLVIMACVTTFDVVARKPWITFIPEVEPRDVPSYFSDFGNTFGHDLCPVAWYFAQVQPDGAVAFCGDFPDYMLGNVRRTPFTEIWHGERATAFRHKLAREPLPVCNRCCGSFVYGRWQRPAPAARA